MFDALNISGTGLYAHRKWLDAVSDNIANINTVSSTDGDAFKERFVVAQAVDYGSGEGGVRVAGASSAAARGGWSTSRPTRWPTSEGYVRYPDIDLGEQMTQLIMAQRGYQANLASVERATDAYKAALNLGKG